ncbi:hypothetical protein J1N35_008442 [Gossypium stocksii]|uniref:Uncharacterized protein n=1 Tax=Gossypium stocksii TaxID=47602 RepID=A0A9D4AG66_9ROSI|nr:hypothetical protein J1N35_008442 [Gossypium stocksii]
MPMRVSSIKHRFFASIDPMTYDSFDIKSGRSFEAMVRTHLTSGSPYLELYVQFSSPSETFVTSTSTVVREEDTTHTRHFVSGGQNMEAPVFGGSMKYTTLIRHSQSTSDWVCYETSIRRNDILLTTSTGEGTSYVADDGGLDDESDVDPPRERDLDGVEVALFFEPEPVLSEPEDVEGGSNEEEKDP